VGRNVLARGSGSQDWLVPTSSPDNEGQSHSSHEHAGHRHHHGNDDDHGLVHFIRLLIGSHSHGPEESLDQVLEGSRQGIRTVAWSLVILLATAGFEALVVVVSGSVALLGDTLHNAADALTGVPLWLAFNLGKRPPTTRFTYRFGKAEDLASFVVGVIAISPGLALYESVERLVHPETVTHLPVVMAAAIVGVISN